MDSVLGWICLGKVMPEFVQKNWCVGQPEKRETGSLGVEVDTVLHRSWILLALMHFFWCSFLVQFENDLGITSMNEPKSKPKYMLKP